MSNEHFVPALPGYRAWDIFEENGRHLATFTGDVVAWRMTQAADCIGPDRRFIGEAVLIGPLEAAVVERDGILFHADCGWPSFESWLTETGAVVCAEDTQRARDWYGIGDAFVETR